jgi:nitrite reductase (NADH) small subunit
MHTSSGAPRRGAPHLPASARPRRAAWYDLGLAAAIPLGEGRVFDVAGTAIAVFRTRGGELFATQPRCPHRGGPLADGIVGGGTVVCPLHALRFDLATGAPAGGSGGNAGGAAAACAALTTYPVHLALDGTVRVCLSAHPPLDAPADVAADADAA